VKIENHIVELMLIVAMALIFMNGVLISNTYKLVKKINQELTYVRQVNLNRP
jgi:hypothetical protein